VTFNRSYREACHELRDHLRHAVGKRLVADVPLGMFLSGRMDSSIICALAQQQLDRPALTFSIGFPEKKYDERDYAQMVSHHLGTDHHFLEVVPNDFDHLRQIVRDYEEPFCDASMLPTSLLAKFTRQNVTVALSGDGADELFGGYYRYRIMHWCRLLTVCPESIRRTLARYLLKIVPPKTEERTFWGNLRRLIEISETSGLQQYLKLISRCPAGLKESLYGDAMKSLAPLPDSLEVLQCFSRSTTHDTSFIDDIMEIDQRTYLVDDILVKVDRASMAYGLEVRSPYLDTEVAEFAMSLPYHWKQQGTQRKMILSDSCSDLLPGEIFQRKKLGFGVPLARWFRGDWLEPSKALLLDGKLVAGGLFRQDRLEWLMKTHLGMKADHSYIIFALLVLEIWMQECHVKSH
jgi:asparagine synthase (glutamine-hydrolysing)